MTITIPRNRVDQLDSTLLDNELYDLLHSSLISCFQQQNLPRIISFMKIRNTDELQVLLKLIIFKFTLWNTESTYGMGLQNLKISNKNKKVYLLFIIIFDYLLKKIDSFLYSIEDDNRHIEICKNVLTKLQNLYKTVSLLNFATFLIDGKYPNLIYRFLQLQLTKLSPNSTSMNDTENISYEFQNRQLVWNTLTEFLIFIIPILKISNYQNFWKLKTKKTDTVLISKKPLNKCAVCIQESRPINITVPYVTNCNHVYCYVCILGKLEKFQQSSKNQSVKEYWSCLECGSDVKWCRPFDDIDKSAIILQSHSITEDTEDIGDIQETEDNDSSYMEDELEYEDEDDTGGFIVQGD